ncbi:MAG: hypothetical protein AMXMBFR22_13910 [Phycisphaerae bacterium]
MTPAQAQQENLGFVLNICEFTRNRWSAPAFIPGENATPRSVERKLNASQLFQDGSNRLKAWQFVNPAMRKPIDLHDMLTPPTSALELSYLNTS